MILDAQNVLTSAQVFTGTGTVVGNNTLDLGTNRDIGAGDEIDMLVNVDVAAAGGTSAEFQIITSTSPALTSPTVIGSTGAIPIANLTAGKQINLCVPRVPDSVGQRYFGIQVVKVGTFTSGSFSAYLVDGTMDRSHYYPSGFVVS